MEVARRLAQLFREPVGSVFNCVVVLLAVATLVGFSPPGGYFVVIVLAFWGWVLVAVVWLARLVGAVGAARSRARSARWLVAPAAVLAVALAIHVDGALQVRYRLSEPAMTRFATRTLADPTSPRPGRIGLWEVGRVETFSGGVRFTVAGAGFVDEDGFAYSPGGPPAHEGDNFYRHLSGPWYLWHWHF